MNDLKYISGDLVEAWIDINTGSLVAEVVGYFAHSKDFGEEWMET